MKQRTYRNVAASAQSMERVPARTDRGLYAGPVASTNRSSHATRKLLASFMVHDGAVAGKKRRGLFPRPRASFVAMYRKKAPKAREVTLGRALPRWFR